MLRIGIVGVDSSHCEAYAGLMNAPGAPFLGRARVTHLWGHDPQQAREKASLCEVPEVAVDVEGLVSEVDAVMVCSRWSEDRFALARAPLQRGKPTYVDKSLGNSIAEARELAALAAEHHALLLCCSPLRFAPQLQDFRCRLSVLGEIVAGTVVGPAHWPMADVRAENPLWYAVHTAEIFHAIAGLGLMEVTVRRDRRATIGFVRTCHGASFTVAFLREMSPAIYCVTAVGPKGACWVEVPEDPIIYRRTLEAILVAAERGMSPVPVEASVEVMEFMDAVFHRARDGEVVSLRGLR